MEDKAPTRYAHPLLRIVGVRLGNDMRSSSAFLLDEGLLPNLCITREVSVFRSMPHRIASGLFPTLHADTPGVERFAQALSEHLLIFGGKCSGLRAKAAHMSGHLPQMTRVERGMRRGGQLVNWVKGGKSVRIMGIGGLSSRHASSDLVCFHRHLVNRPSFCQFGTCDLNRSFPVSPSRNQTAKQADEDSPGRACASNVLVLGDRLTSSLFYSLVQCLSTGVAHGRPITDRVVGLPLPWIRQIHDQPRERSSLSQ